MDRPIAALTPRAYPLISVVLPAYNEAAGLPAVVERVIAQIGALDARPEILIVDDGSVDATPLAARMLCDRYPEVRYLRLSRNFGKEAALTAGIDRARGDAVVLMDADGQHPPALIAEFVAAWRAGAESVYAIQRRHGEPRIKRTMKRLFYRALRLGASVGIPPDAGDFRLLDRRVVDALKSLPERNRFMKGLYAWVGFNAVPIPYDPLPRPSGESHFGWRALFGLGLTGITSFSVMPLRLVSLLGVLLSILALGEGIEIVVETLVLGSKVPGFATIAAGVMLLSGVQLIALGVLGEYLGRVFEEVKQRPLYLVAEDIAHEAGEPSALEATPSHGGARREPAP